MAQTTGRDGMITWILDNEENPTALIVRSDFRPDGIEFLTPSSFALQVGYMVRKQGESIQAHIHSPVLRTTEGTQEVLLVRKGLMRIHFFQADETYLDSVEVRVGDLILLITGGHSFDIIEEVDLIEVKQGPFDSGSDKRRFEPDIHSRPSPEG
jgi:hypothetical protein